MIQWSSGAVKLLLRRNKRSVLHFQPNCLLTDHKSNFFTYLLYFHRRCNTSFFRIKDAHTRFYTALKYLRLLTSESTSEGWHRKSSKIDALNSTIQNIEELKEQIVEAPANEHLCVGLSIQSFNLVERR